MSEYDKMIAGKLYDPSDGELTAMRMRARRLCAAYNSHIIAHIFISASLIQYIVF